MVKITTIRALALTIPFHHDFIDRWGDVPFKSSDWQIDRGKLVLDLAKVREGYAKEFARKSIAYHESKEKH
jgi:hypothetical protein